MYTIKKKFGPYAAKHQLVGLEAGHQCMRDHGHNYEFEIELASDSLDEHGFVHDYGQLKEFDSYLKECFDHQNINETLGFQTTAENIAKHLFEMATHLYPGKVQAIIVSETPGKTLSEYRRPALIDYRRLPAYLR